MRIAVAGMRGFPGIQGGVETHGEMLYPRISRLGCEVTVMRRRPFVHETPPLTSWQGVRFRDLDAPARMGVEALVHTLRSVWAARRMRADIIHIHAIGPSLAVPFARLLGLKVVVTHHGPDYDRLKWGAFARLLLRTGERCAARQADAIIVISTVIRDILKTKYGRTRGVHLIYNGVRKAVRATSTRCVRELGLTPGNYVLAVGRFVEEKNFDRLVAAFASAARPDGCRLVIAGAADHATAYSARLTALAELHDVVLAGMVKGKALSELYSHARLFVLPSSHEGLPFTLLEAMSFGRDVLVSDIAANRAVNLPAECYFHYSDDPVPALREALADRLSRPAAPRAYDLSPYDWDTIAEQTLAVYREVLGDSTFTI
ncbi:MAG: glycosyltransferase family 4 protein [Tannerella sp.]|jgi:glycosyltransferase involved in cell wall biosynthesis|nr:glycosyltransferase family 4 protein [Tannerella sp.]